MRKVLGILRQRMDEYLDKAYEATNRQDNPGYIAELIDNALECRRAIVVIEDYLIGD